MPDKDTPVPKSPYSTKELEHFKNLLLKEREETKEEIDELKSSIEGLDEMHDDTSSSQDHHAGDLGTEEENKETNYALIERDLDKLKQINAALDRIDNNTYGICESTGKKIRKERLEAIPYTRFSIEGMEQQERMKTESAISNPDKLS